MAAEIPIRITVVHPPPGVVFRVQSGRSDLVAPTEKSGARVVFDLALRVAEPRPDGTPDFRGACVQGKPGERFVYVCSGTLAGGEASPWTRRMKVHLSTVPAGLVEQALADPSVRLEARVAGTAQDGGPACASVPLLAGGWRAGTMPSPASTDT